MLLIDTHVHIYDCFKLNEFFNAAWANFQRAAQTLQGGAKPFQGFLLLTESAGNNRFQDLAKASSGSTGAQNRLFPDWRISRTGESFSLKISGEHGEILYLCAGRQIVTAENLEVLAVLTDGRFEEGRSLMQTVQAVERAGAIPIIPWGFGKWLGKRGALLQDFIVNGAHEHLFLGDNSGRPFFWPTPSMFRVGEQRNIRHVRGSDPLPFAAEVGKPGSFGSAIDRQTGEERPGTELKSLLLDRTAPMQQFGNLENPYRFFRHQITMQLVKRSTRR